LLAVFFFLFSFIISVFHLSFFELNARAFSTLTGTWEKGLGTSRRTGSAGQALKTAAAAAAARIRRLKNGASETPARGQPSAVLRELGENTSNLLWQHVCFVRRQIVAIMYDFMCPHCAVYFCRYAASYDMASQGGTRGKTSFQRVDVEIAPFFWQH
jgi:hypothetical protein